MLLVYLYSIALQSYVVFFQKPLGIEKSTYPLGLESHRMKSFCTYITGLGSKAFLQVVFTLAEDRYRAGSYWENCPGAKERSFAGMQCCECWIG